MGKKQVKLPIEYMAKFAHYIKMSQAYIAKLEYDKKNLRDKVAHAVGSMVDKGYIQYDETNTIIDALTDYPEKIAEVLNQVVKTSEMPQLGSVSDKEDNVDGLTQLALNPQAFI